MDTLTTNIDGAEPLEPSAQTTFPLSPIILYEDDALLVVEKPSGQVVHPAYKHPVGSGALTDIVFAHQRERGEPQPWLLHRLDRETSGAVIFAKTIIARRALTRQFERRSIEKRYLAFVCDGGVADCGMIDAPLRRDPLDRRRTITTPDGKPSRTSYHIVARASGYALVLAQPHTGRTHQIRAHFAASGMPILGDATYLPQGHLAAALAPRVMLHAWRLRLIRPSLGTQLTITAPLPTDMLALAEHLGLRAAIERLDHLATLAEEYSCN